MRGYSGIGIYKNKWRVNSGTLVRSSWFLGADLFFTIGRRYKKQPSDTKLHRHVPIFNFETLADFKKVLPKNCEVVFVELSEKASSLKDFEHPERAMYILGAEDKGIPERVMSGHKVIQIPQVKNRGSMNVAVAGSIVLYDRLIKQK